MDDNLHATRREEEVEVSLLIALLFALRSGDRLRTEVTSKFKIEGF